jgi:hypothetical protein
MFFLCTGKNMNSAKSDLFEVTLDILKGEEVNAAAIAELESTGWDRLYSSDEACYFILTSELLSFNLLACLTIGDDPILHKQDKESGDLIRLDWEYWFDDAEDEYGITLPE